jgi:hypothetical protein
MHSLRHTLATRLKMSGVASAASFDEIGDWAEAEVAA